MKAVANFFNKQRMVVQTKATFNISAADGVCVIMNCFCNQ